MAAVLALHGGVVGVKFIFADKSIAITVDAGELFTLARMGRSKLVARNAAVFIGINRIERVLRRVVGSAVLRRCRVYGEC